jgi:hypothetical protein
MAALAKRLGLKIVTSSGLGPFVLMEGTTVRAIYTSRLALCLRLRAMASRPVVEVSL